MSSRAPRMPRKKTPPKKPTPKPKNSTEDDSLRNLKEEKSNEDSESSSDSDPEVHQKKAKEAREEQLKELSETISTLETKLAALQPTEPEFDKKQRTLRNWLDKLAKEKKQLENSDKASKYDSLVILLILAVIFGAIFFSKMNEEFYARFSWANTVDYYESLGLTPDASSAEIKRRYKELAVKLHPDKNPDCKDCASQFLAAQEAYEVLGDEEKRKAYDETNGVVNFIRSATVELTTANFERLVEKSESVWIIQVYENNSHACERFGHFWEEAAKRLENRFISSLKFGRVNYRSQKGLLKKLPFGITELPFVLAMGRTIEPEFMNLKLMHNIEVTLNKFVGSVVGSHLGSALPTDLALKNDWVAFRLKKEPKDKFEANLFARAFKEYFGVQTFLTVDPLLTEEKIQMFVSGKSTEIKTKVGLRESLRAIFELLFSRFGPFVLSKESFQRFCKNTVKCMIIGSKTPQNFLSESKAEIEKLVIATLKGERPADFDSFLHILQRQQGENPRLDRWLLSQVPHDVIVIKAEAEAIAFGKWMDLYSIEEVRHLAADEFAKMESLFGKKKAFEDFLRPENFGFISYVFKATISSIFSPSILNIGIIALLILLNRKFKMGTGKSFGLFFILHLALAIKDVQDL